MKKLTREQELQIIRDALAYGTAISIHYIEPSPHFTELEEIDFALADLRMTVMPFAPRLTKSKTWETNRKPSKRRLQELREDWEVDE
jgi:hypothetical protein